MLVLFPSRGELAKTYEEYDAGWDKKKKLTPAAEVQKTKEACPMQHRTARARQFAGQPPPPPHTAHPTSPTNWRYGYNEHRANASGAWDGPSPAQNVFGLSSSSGMLWKPGEDRTAVCAHLELRGPLS